MARKITFDRDPPPGTINFGIGQPSDDLLPVALMRDAAERFFSRARPADLNYGERQGDARFRRALAAFLAAEYGAPASADELFLTAGNSQALDFVCALFTRPGDTVVVEEPSYFLAFRIFEDHGLNIVPVPLDGAGLDVTALENVLTRTRPTLLYTIPSYHNPAGQCMGEQRRQRLVELSREHDFIIVADEVYQMLWYDQRPPPALGTMRSAGKVLSLGSFSKILAPGSRLGWIQASDPLLERLLDAGAVNSGGSLNQLTSLIVHELLASGELTDFVEQLRATYARRVEVMDASLREHLGTTARWQRPDGGYFFWLEFAEEVDTAALRAAADRYETGFQPGRNSSSRGALNNCLRLSFARYGEDEIREGVARLARLYHEAGPRKP
jgi:DNA-binding transcriptional MocR family regulator